MSLIECKDLCIGYGSKILQENLNFSVEEGDYFFIIGENGQGKSTLMKTILGFEKPVSGAVIFSKDFNKKDTGYLSQVNDIQKTFPATVWEIVLSGFQGELGVFPFYKKAFKDMARENLKKVGMEGFANKCFKELSGGQQQRVLFARTLCAAKKLLVLDEPSKGFDSEMTEIMYSLIEDLNKKGMTVLTISHDHDAAKKYGSKILKLEKTWEIL